MILDVVFHHAGRDFWAFRDLQGHGEASRYRDWFAGLDFARRSPYGDAFTARAGRLRIEAVPGRGARILVLR